MVANLLRRCGLVLGADEELVGASTSNLAGHHEHRGFLNINEALLDSLGGAWKNPPDCDPGWEHSPVLNDLVRDAQLLLENFPNTLQWGWKEPRTTILLPFWKRLVPNLRFVICIRNPVEVAHSVAKRDGLSISGGAYLWNLYTQAAIRNTTGCPRVLTFYDDYFHCPREEVARVASFCNLNVPADWSVIEQSISAKFRNHLLNSSDLLEETSIPTEFKLWYLAARGLFHDVSMSGADKCATLDGLAVAAGKLLSLMDEFSSEREVARLQAVIASTDHEWSIRMVQELERLNGKICELENSVHRLQLFSDTVRATLAYRLYRGFIRPLSGNWMKELL